MMHQVVSNLGRIMLIGWLGVQGFAPPSAYGADLDTIRARGYLIVGVKDDARPLGWRDDQGQWQGLEIDLAHRLAETILGKPEAVKFVPVANPDRLQAVIDDRVDLTIAQLTATPARARLVYFSDPYYLNGISFVTQARAGQPPLRDLSQLRDQPVAVLNQSVAIAALQYHQPNLRLVGVDSYATAQAKLAAGEVGAIAGSTSVLVGWSQTQPDYQLIPSQFNRTPLAIAYAKGRQSAELGTIVSRSVRQWQQSGWLQERAINWGLPWDRLRE
jgi:polar amino acid transport system substrate-binding protein